MFIEKFALKNTNAQYQYICASVFCAKNLHNCTCKSIVITHSRMYVATLVLDGWKIFC